MGERFIFPLSYATDRRLSKGDLRPMRLWRNSGGGQLASRAAARSGLGHRVAPIFILLML